MPAAAVPLNRRGRPMSSAAIPPSRSPRVFGGDPLHADGDLLALAFAEDGILWSVEEPGALRGWNVAARRQIAFHPLDEMGTFWAFNWAARLVAAVSDEVSVYEAASGEQLATWPTASWITAVAFQPGAATLATGHDDGRVRIWDWQKARLLRELEAHDRPASALAFSADGTWLASAG